MNTYANGDPNLFALTYTYHARDGSQMIFDCNVLSTYHNSSEGIVDWTANVGIKRQEDRFGNALIYTWAWDPNTPCTGNNDFKYITKIENNRTDARIEFENNFDFLGTPVDLYSKAKLITGTGENETVARTVEYGIEIRNYDEYENNSMWGVTYEVTRDGDQVAQSEPDIGTGDILDSATDSIVGSYWYSDEDGGLSLVGVNVISDLGSSAPVVNISKRLWYDESDRLTTVVDRFDCSNSLQARYICNDYVYDYDSLGNLVTTATNYGDWDAAMIENDSMWNVQNSSSFDGGQNKLKAVISTQNSDGANSFEVTIPYPDAANIYYTGDLRHGVYYWPYGDT
ncbi:MAG: hypothetical protein KAJ95_08150, partial [Gammaproteobacteria bacterium]|nr:hypothetical protein [Gammaproteobacteria bacterium]